MKLADGERDKIDILFSKFEVYCKPKQNVTIERYRFNTRVQTKHETIDQYLTELKLIAKNCSFGELENQLIQERIVCGTKSEEVRQRLLRVEELSLDKAISVCRAEEESKKSAQYLAEGQSVQVYELKRHTKKPRTSATGKPEDSRKQSVDTPQSSGKHLCNNCSLQHPRKQCPA